MSGAKSASDRLKIVLEALLFMSPLAFDVGLSSSKIYVWVKVKIGTYLGFNLICGRDLRLTEQRFSETCVFRRELGPLGLGEVGFVFLNDGALLLYHVDQMDLKFYNNSLILEYQV